MAIAAWERYQSWRYTLYRWRYEESLVVKIALALGMAALTGLAAQIRIPLPWSPVPITGQTFAVLLSAVLLGQWWGGTSQGLYLGLGAAGIPWFTGGAGGLAYLLTSPTTGYIVGFIVAALFLGHFMDRYIRARSFFAMLVLMLFANFFIIHTLGLLRLGLYLSLVKGMSFTLPQLLWMGTIPFIPGDITKAVAAAALTKGITPKQAYNGEVDIAKAKNWRLP